MLQPVHDVFFRRGLEGTNSSETHMFSPASCPVLFIMVPDFLSPPCPTIASLAIARWAMPMPQMAIVWLWDAF